MFVIGIDPHRGSHAAAVLDGDEEVLDVLHVGADRRQRERLLAWAERFTPRLWAIEGATGTGALLAQQLVAAGEAVVDVPPKLAARVRLLDQSHSDKTDTTTPARQRSSPCAPVSCDESRSRTTRRCCACWPSAITT